MFHSTFTFIEANDKSKFYQLTSYRATHSDHLASLPQRSTFTFIFRAFASIDGIGKGLDKDFDIGQLSQPFVEELTEQARYGDVIEGSVNPTQKAFSQVSVFTVGRSQPQPKITSIQAGS